MTKTQYIIAGAALLTAFAVGRFMTPEKVKIEKQVVEVEKIKEVRVVDEHRTTTEVVKPDGTRTTTTTSDTLSTTSEVTSRDTTTNESKEIDNGSNKISISALAGLDITNPSKGFVYGAHVSKPLLGPISFGVFGLTNGTAGISVGLKL